MFKYCTNTTTSNKMDNYLNSIIVGVFGLVGVVLGFCLQLLANHLNEKKYVRKEFAEIRKSIYSTTIANNLFLELKKMKQYFIRHPELLKKTENQTFYEKWLTIPFVDEGFTGSGFWSKEKLEEMKRDLDKTE